MFILGAPFSEAGQQAYLTKFRTRFDPTADPKERAVDYLNRILDRQINKGRGLLTYNALLLTAINTWPAQKLRFAHAELIADVVRWERLMVIVSCALLLVLFRMGWGRSASDYENACNDLTSTFKTLAVRTQLLSIALYLAFLATGFLFCTSW